MLTSSTLHLLILVLSIWRVDCLPLKPPKTCALSCNDDFVEDVSIWHNSSNVDFWTLSSEWQTFFHVSDENDRKQLCWHFWDYDHCLRHCGADPEVFLPVRLEPLKAVCRGLLPDYVGAIECLGQYHKAAESNCRAYANSIKMALDSWKKTENFCLLMSQHVQCLTINVEFYCGSQLADEKLLSANFHTMITFGTPHSTVKPLLAQCFNPHPPDPVLDQSDQMTVASHSNESSGDAEVSTAPNLAVWPPESTESNIPDEDTTATTSMLDFHFEDDPSNISHLSPIDHELAARSGTASTAPIHFPVVSQAQPEHQIQNNRSSTRLAFPILAFVCAIFMMNFYGLAGFHTLVLYAYCI